MEERRNRRPHCLVLTFPAQGHVNPMFQFSKRLDHKGVRVTIVTSRFLCKTLQFKSASIALESVSDGFDHGGMWAAESDKAYFDCFREVGSKTLEELIQKLTSSGNPVDCVVYDSFLPWALEVTKKFGIMAASFFTQSCAVNSMYYHVHSGNLKIPLAYEAFESQILLPGLPPLASCDLPSFFNVLGPYAALTEVVVNQFFNVEKADWLLCNSFFELEAQVADWLAKLFPLKTIGPTIPSMFLDKRVKDNYSYGFSFYREEDEACMNWLNDKPSGSVVYVSFGSMSALNTERMQEMAWGLKDSDCYFLWVVREYEKPMLPKGFLRILQNENKGLVVTWCPQLKVLNHEAVGCFVTHCGWNSTLEAVSLGVPMVGVPQWTDQPTDAKFIKDVWKIGVKAVADNKGVVRRETLKNCIEIVMKSERGKEMRKNAMKWKNLAVKACDEGGSTDKNIDDFVASFSASTKCH